ncbi:MAG: hypothetical protein ABW221_24790 [Vicinamibacteria bacterium]
MSLFGAVAETSAYDTVVCTDASGERHLTRSEFEKMTLVDRVRLLAGGEVRFFQGAREIEKSVALARR